MVTLEDVVGLTILLMFGYRNVVGIVFEGEDEAKLQFLTSAVSS